MTPDPRTGAKDPILLVMAGPAGSGKSTLCDRLVAAGLGFTRVVTSTTRAPRVGEVNGVHYHFFSPAEFDAKDGGGGIPGVGLGARRPPLRNACRQCPRAAPAGKISS